MDQLRRHPGSQGGSGEDDGEPDSLLTLVIHNLIERHIRFVFVIAVDLRVLRDQFPQISCCQHLLGCTDLLPTILFAIWMAEGNLPSGNNSFKFLLITVGLASFRTPVITTFVCWAVQRRLLPSTISSTTSWLCSPPASSTVIGGL